MKDGSGFDRVVHPIGEVVNGVVGAVGAVGAARVDGFVLLPHGFLVEICAKSKNEGFDEGIFSVVEAVRVAEVDGFKQLPNVFFARSPASTRTRALV